MNENDRRDRRKLGNRTESDRDARDDIDLVNKVRQIFTAKNWPIDEKDQLSGEGPFERTIRMLTQLDKEEANLLLNLLNRFVRFEFDQYLVEMKKMVMQLVKAVAPQRIAIVPIKSLKDSIDGRSKSGDMMGVIARTAFAGWPVRVESYNNLEAARVQAFVGQLNSYIVGVDDFIGTGNTAASFIENCLRLFPNQLSHLKLASLVSLEQGARLIQSRGCDLYCLHKFGKGISDYVEWNPNDKRRYVGTMGKIEDRIGVRSEFRMGYGRSEGLVKMMRTPNNTFPVFWVTNAYNGAPWPATFPR